LKTSYKIAPDIVVWIHLAQALGLWEHINENCGKGLDYLTDHKILKKKLWSVLYEGFSLNVLMNVHSRKT
jgi:hypothetical protein